MKNASGFGQSDEGRASNSGAAPLAREQAACECPARKALEALLSDIPTADDADWARLADARAALAAPCPCEGLREDPVIRCGNCEASLFHKKTEEGYRTIHSCWPKWARESFSALQAERDQLRADLAEALDVLKPFAEAWASRRPSFDDKHLFSIVCLPEERLTFDRIVALFTNVSTRASGEPPRMEARASQDCPIPKEIL